ncbi:MAG: PmoA family protein [Massilibacteroides sp.]|nr:PmoA family protein [Massilibacteroides sp.]
MKNALFFLCLLFSGGKICAGIEADGFSFVHDVKGKQLTIFYNRELIASYLYPDSLDKPVIYPLKTFDGIEVTRGYPLAPRTGERVDHPHQIGVWFNFGDVNGLDFWNNSSAIPIEKKEKYGSIRHRGFSSIEGCSDCIVFVVEADWVNHAGKRLLREETRYRFTKEDDALSLVHTSILTALEDTVILDDNKEGLFAIRVARELEEWTEAPDYFIGADGQVSETKISNSGKANGVYRNSEGLERGDAWGKEASWVVLSACKEGIPVSIAIFDYSENPGYPACFHARGYGLFSVNNLGKRAFDKKLDPIRIRLAPREQVCFKHKLMLRSGGCFSDEELRTIFREFN